MAGRERQSTHRNYSGARENEETAENHHQSRSFSREPHYSAEAEYRDRNGHVFRSRPSSHGPRLRHWEPPNPHQNCYDSRYRSRFEKSQDSWTSESHDRYTRNRNEAPYPRRQSSHQERTYSHFDQWENEQESAGVFPPGSLRAPVSSRRMRTSRESTSSEVNGNNQSIPPSPRPSVDRSTRGSHDQYARNRYQETYPRQQSYYRRGSYSHPDQGESEQESAGMFTPGSSARPAFPRRMRSSQEMTSSDVNGNNQSIPPSPRPKGNRVTRESHDRYARNRYEDPYPRQQSSYREGTYSPPDQWDNEQQSAGVLRSGSLTRPASPRRMRSSQERTSSEANDNNQSILPTPRLSVDRSTRIDPDQNISSPPALQPPKPRLSSSTRIDPDQNISNPPALQPPKPGPSASTRKDSDQHISSLSALQPPRPKPNSSTSIDSDQNVSSPPALQPPKPRPSPSTRVDSEQNPSSPSALQPPRPKPNSSMSIADSDQNISNPPALQPSKPGSSASTRIDSDQNISSPPALQPPKPRPSPSTMVDSDQNFSSPSAIQPPKPKPSSSTRTDSDQNIRSPPALQPLKPRPSSSTERSLEGNVTKQPVSSSSKPVKTSAVILRSIVLNSGKNQAEQSSQNSENQSQATSTKKNASNQQVPPPPEPGVSSSKNLPSLVLKKVLKKSEQSSRKSEDGPRIGKNDERHFIHLVSKNPHLYDPANPSFHDKEYTKKSWTSIGETFGVSAERCKSRWQTMRRRYKQRSMELDAGHSLPKGAKQFVNDMSFLSPTKKSIQEKPKARTESCDSDQPLLNSIAAELRRLSPDQKGLFKSKIHGILAEFSRVV